VELGKHFSIVVYVNIFELKERLFFVLHRLALLPYSLLEVQRLTHAFKTPLKLDSSSICSARKSSSPRQIDHEQTLIV
jgi:hypothetical protein